MSQQYGSGCASVWAVDEWAWIGFCTPHDLEQEHLRGVWMDVLWAVIESDMDAFIMLRLLLHFNENVYKRVISVYWSLHDELYIVFSHIFVSWFVRLKKKKRGCMFVLFPLVLHSERCYCKWIMFSWVIFHLILFHSSQEVSIFSPPLLLHYEDISKSICSVLTQPKYSLSGHFFMAGCKFPTALSDCLCLCVGVFTGEVFSYSPVHIICPEAVVCILQITLLQQINQ